MGPTGKWQVADTQPAFLGPNGGSQCQQCVPNGILFTVVITKKSPLLSWTLSRFYVRRPRFTGIHTIIQFPSKALQLTTILTVSSSSCTLLRSHAWHFFCAFLLHIRIKYPFLLLFFSRSYTISSLYILVVGNTPYGKRHISRTKPVYGKLNILD